MSAPQTSGPVSDLGLQPLIEGLNQLIEFETDAELLSKYVQCRDRTAMERLIVRYGPMVYSVCRATALSKSDAEDAFQATFLVLIQSANKVRKQSSLAAWLHGVAYRTASRTRMRSQRVQRQLCDWDQMPLDQLTLDQGDQQVDPIALVARQIELEWLFKELEQLPQNLKNALVEHYLHGFSTKEISQRMEISVSAVEGRLKRGRKMLRSRLIRHGLSLSVALGAVEILKNQVQAAESGVLASKFIGQQLSIESLTESSSFISPDVSSLVKGEIAMLKKSLLVKSTLATVVLGSFSAVTALAFMEDSSAGIAQKDGQTIIVSSTQSESEAAKIPAVVLGQSKQASNNASPNPAPANQPGPRNLSDPFLQPNSTIQANQPVRTTPPSMPTANTASNGNTNFPPATSNSTQAPTTQAQIQLTTANQQAAPVAQTGPRTGQTSATKEPAPIVKWKAPEGEKPSWMRGGEEQDRAEQKKDQVRKQLRDTMWKSSMDFQATPLNRVLEIMQDDSKIAIYLNQAELDNDGVPPDTPVTFSVPECSYREALELMLKPLGLTYRIREFGLEITTEASVDDSSGSVRTYDLSFLYRDSSNVDALINTIVNSIEPDRWIHNGGAMSISVVGSMLVVSCPDSTHYKIEDLLRSLAKMSPENSTPQVTIRNPATQGMGGMGGGMF